MQFLKNRISLSTLTVVFYEKASGSFGFNSKFTQALHDGWTNILWFFIALANLWAFLLIGIISIESFI
ncbi:MAG: DUF4349 domain-containing protein [Candidatus Symbiothrix sp.]|nr:DUF4349 domain-containing protein [Candidatus Symbiothrix sp.]